MITKIKFLTDYRDYRYPTYDFVLKYDTSRICPYCGITNYKPAVLAYSPVMNGLEANFIKTAYIIFDCPECKKVFMAAYDIELCEYDSLNKDILYNSYFLYMAPAPSSKVMFEKEIEEVSCDFVKIYNDAKAIENNGDVESAGMIYRKALEFLIKDYLINFKYKDAEDEIKKISKIKNLKDVITTYFAKDDNLKCPSILVAYIGNDYSHYEKKNEDLNIEDLKNFLDTFVAFIKYNIRASRSKILLEDIDRKSKK